MEKKSAILLVTLGAVFVLLQANSVPALASQPAYRFWSQTLERYFYTISESEKQKLLDNYPHVWTYEGIAFYVYAEGQQPVEAKPVYRFWSPVFGAHFYTISEAEKNDFIDSDVWLYEGVAFYAYVEGEQPVEAKPLYRFCSSSVIYFYTMNETEKNKLIDIYSHLWTYEAVAWYAFSPPTLTSIVPDNAQQAESLSVTIAGQDTHFTQGSGTTRVWFSQGSSTIDATSFSPSSDTSLSASFDIPGDASVGSWRLHVQDDIDDTLTLAYGFTITSLPTSLTVLTPNGSEVLSAGSTYPISWSSTGSISNIVIEYSSNNGTNWITIDTVPNTGSYSWLVPEVISNQCLVRVIDASNPSVFDTSNSTFSIRLARLFVDADATGANDGSSWEDAYKYLQDALAIAGADDQIWVAEGTYKPDANTANPEGTGEWTATFQLINGVGLYGGYAGYGAAVPNERNWQTNETILSGDLDGNDVQGLDPCDLLDEPTRGENSYHVVTGSGTDATAVLDGFTITAGNARYMGDDLYPYDCGGGMYNNSGSPTVVNCTFSRNSAVDVGGGMSNYNSGPTVMNCTFSGNSAAYDGGGMDNENSSPMVSNCAFIGNSAAGDSWGGGMCNANKSSPTVTNCTFSGNTAYYGGGMYNDEYDGSGSNPTLTNCILWGNTAPTGPQIYTEAGSSPTVSYSDVQGGWPGMGNIDEDPLFIGLNGLDGIGGTADDEEDNVHLRGYSPCINAGDPGGDYSGQVDIDRQPRVAYGRVDMGADEVFPIAGDFEPDGNVDFADFAIFAGNWLLGY